jgi:hypothetical protein
MKRGILYYGLLLSSPAVLMMGEIGKQNVRSVPNMPVDSRNVAKVKQETSITKKSATHKC